MCRKTSKSVLFGLAKLISNLFQLFSNCWKHFFFDNELKIITKYYNLDLVITSDLEEILRQFYSWAYDQRPRPISLHQGKGHNSLVELLQFVIRNNCLKANSATKMDQFSEKKVILLVSPRRFSSLSISYWGQAIS